MLNFMIVVDDGGEMKTVTASEIDAYADECTGAGGVPSSLTDDLQTALNTILDRRAIAAGEYDPADDSTPFSVTISGD